MIKKQPFNEAGLSAVLEMLYNLNNDALLAEVSKLENNFSDWINTQFELTPQQATFFGQLNAQIMNFVTHQTAFAVANRLPISLIKLNEKATGEANTDGDKLFTPKSSLYATGNASGGIEAGGELVVEVIYPS